MEYEVTRDEMVRRVGAEFRELVETGPTELWVALLGAAARLGLPIVGNHSVPVQDEGLPLPRIGAGIPRYWLLETSFEVCQAFETLALDLVGHLILEPYVVDEIHPLDTRIIHDAFGESVYLAPFVSLGCREACRKQPHIQAARARLV